MEAYLFHLIAFIGAIAAAAGLYWHGWRHGYEEASKLTEELCDAIQGRNDAPDTETRL